MKFKFRKFSTRGKIVILSGALVLITGAGYAIGKNTNKKSESDKQIESTVDNSTEATVTNVVETSEFDKYYDEINVIEDDVVAAINDGLAKGMYDYELTEDMKETLAKTYLDYYLVMNQDKISGITYDILNQDKDMSAMEMMNNAMTQEQLIQEQANISEEGIELDYSNIIVNETDKEFIADLAHTVASMHTAYNNNDKEELDRLAAHVIEIKEGIMQDNAEYSMLYNPMTIDLAIMLIDAADRIYDGQIIKDDEDLAQIFNTSYVRCIDGSYVSSMTDERIIALAAEFEIEGYQTMSREEILEAISALNAKGVSEVSIRSNLRAIAKASIAEIITNTERLQCSEAYSYDSLVESIKEQIDLSLQVRPEKNYLDVLNENPFGPNNYKPNPDEEQPTTEYVPEDEVPEGEKEPTTEDVIDEDTGKETNEVYLQAKAAAIKAGSADAAAAYASTYAGNAEAMPTKPVGEAPSLTCEDYNTVYTYFYNLEWNNCRSSYIAAEAAAKKEDEEATTEYEQVDGTEEITDETEPEEVNFEDDEEFVPVVSISQLKNTKRVILELYGESYDLAYNTEGGKKM